MSPDHSDSKLRGDRMTTDFFEDVLAEYLEADRIDAGVVRLRLDDGRTRRFVIGDETESMAPYEYVRRELAEVKSLIDGNEDRFDQPVEFSVPVRDAERVITEAEDEGAVTTWIKPEGVGLLLEHLHAMADETDVDPPAETNTTE
ncbi:hypothetical protein [Natrinema pallidum]|uniref:Uncharacterized protein n=2 Tax=Natrinema pallidum TaxID=69527 RepID=L9YM41_9EURY|nr:hypothetical protein C487_15304 [Natrinema pallidum DSM 3751]